MKRQRLLNALLAAQVLVACDSVPRSPVSPSAGSATVPVSIAIFTDAATGFATSDVNDAQEQVVRFNSNFELVWTESDQRFSGYRVTATRIGDGNFEVAFGTRNGERRAYLTFGLDYYHYDPPPTVVDLEVIDGKLIVVSGGPPVPLPGGF